MPKGAKRELKASQREPKGRQKATKMHPKINLGARVDFGCKKSDRVFEKWLQKWYQNPPKIKKNFKKTSKNLRRKRRENIRQNVNSEGLKP